ncbi:MAG TPA: FAD-dependent oxidoreductase, partial [Leptospiraceae bacterium]|nr:FAD-dependent oxidoreductase [Leptospiraceae bacterium]
SLIATGDRSDVCSRLSSEYQGSFVKNNLDNIELLSTLKFEKIQMKSWQNESFIEGATSYYMPGTYDVKNILRKNHGRVFFSGEHLSIQSGTMEGALLSAIEVVNSL